jgi:hypothetical protein
MNLAIQRRARLIQRLDLAREQHNGVKCDQIMMMLQGENEIIGDCRRQLGEVAE